MFGRARNDPFEHRIAPAVHMARCQLFTRPNMALHEHPCARVLFALHAPTIRTGECVQQHSGLYQLFGCTFPGARHLNGHEPSVGTVDGTIAGAAESAAFPSAALARAC